MMDWEIQIYYDLEAVRDQWNYFFEATPTSSTTMTWTYANQWWTHFGATFDSAVPYIITVTDDFNHGLLLPLIKQGRNLSWLGAPDAGSLSMLYNNPNKLPDAVAVLAGYLRKQSWSKLNLDKLHSSQADLLLSAMHPIQHQIHRETQSPSLLLYGRSWGQYREVMPAKLRADLRRKYRQLELEGRQVQFEDVRHPKLIEDYAALFEQMDVYTSAFQRAFWRDYAECGWLELSLCYFDVTPVAYVLVYTLNGATTVASSGTLASYRDYAPDKLLMEHVLKNSFDRGDYIFDFQPEPEEHKRQWTDEYQPLSDVSFYHTPLTIFNYQLTSFTTQKSTVGERS